MPSKRQIRFTLGKSDYELFHLALAKYGMTETELLKEIVHAWLFSNKLKLENNGKNRTRKTH